MRKIILIPAIALAAGLFLTQTAQAQPPMPPRHGHSHGPAMHPPGMPLPPRPAPAIGIGIRPSPNLGIGISIGGPVPVYPIHRPPVIVVDPVHECYRVVYRECAHDPWRTYRVYHSHRLAHDVADQLGAMGYQTRVSHE